MVAGIVESERAYNLAQMIANYGAPVTIRNLTNLTGPTPSPNPFNLNSLVASGIAAIGATHVNLRALLANGRFVPGDTLQFGADPTVYTVATQNASSANAFTAVAFTPPLVVATTDGEAVAVGFSADYTIAALVTCYKAYQVNGTTVQAGDTQVRFLASAVSFTPKITDKMLIGSNSFSIVNVKSMDIQGAPYGFSVQIRGGTVG